MGLIEVKEWKSEKKPAHTISEKIKVLTIILLICERWFNSLAVHQQTQASVSVEI